MSKTKRKLKKLKQRLKSLLGRCRKQKVKVPVPVEMAVLVRK